MVFFLIHDEKVLLLWYVTFINETFCDTYQIYMKLVNLLRQFIIIDLAKWATQAPILTSNITC